jgi:hypothetical protein
MLGSGTGDASYEERVPTVLVTHLSDTLSSSFAAVVESAGIA